MERCRKNFTTDKKRFTIEEKIIKIQIYEKYISKYPQAQLCNFYLRGLCCLINCQFAHGINNMDILMFKQFIEDKKKKLLTNDDLVRNVQRNYLITKRDYKILFDFQEKHKQFLNIYYSYEQLNSDPRKRVEIRRIFHQNQFENFCKLIFSEFGTMTIEEFEDILDSSGFSYNFRYFQGKMLFSKSLFDKTLNKKRSIISPMPEPILIIEKFVDVIHKEMLEIVKLNEVSKIKEIFPLSFKWVNSVINKNISFEDPLTHHYLKLKNITQSEFMQEIIENPTFIKLIENLFKNNSLELPPPEERIYNLNLFEILNELKETCWEKYFNSLNTDNYYGYMNFEFIKRNYINKICDNPRCNINENSLNFFIKKILLLNKNLFFMNNNYKLFLINPTLFNNYNLEDYFESIHEKRCEVGDNDIQLIIGKLRENENPFDSLLKFIKESLNLTDELDYDSTQAKIYQNNEIIIVDDNLSLLFFVEKSRNFKKISVDLEGVLWKVESKIDLIQIADDTSNLIYVLDIFKIMELSESPGLQISLKLILTYILENTEITKIFHDGRNDCLALHNFFEICPCNYVDTATVFSAVKQFKLQIEFSKNNHGHKNKDLFDNSIDSDLNNLYSYIHNSVRPGLNKVLESYEEQKRTNHLKDKMHEMFSKPDTRQDYFLKRPIEKDFLIYSALDVKYLSSALNNLEKELSFIIKQHYGDSITKFIDIIIRLLSNDHLKTQCGVIHLDKNICLDDNKFNDLVI